MPREFSEALLQDGLNDVLEECVAALTADANPFPAQECIGLVRKFFGVAIVVSFTGHNRLLASFSEAMRELVLGPIIKKGDHGPMKDYGVAIMHVDVTTALISSLAGPAQIAGGPEPAGVAEIEHLACLCYRQYEWAWKAFRLFDWLAAYLARYRGRADITAKQLLMAAEQTVTHGRPFTLSDISSEGPSEDPHTSA